VDEAAESGLFESASGRGQPLTLTPDDPNVPADLRLAFRVMRNANVSPPWITLAGEVEQALETLRRQIRQHEQRMRRIRENLIRGHAADFKDEFASALAVHRRQRCEFARSLDETRAKVDKLAATAPDGAPPVMFRRSTFLRRFDDIWPWPEHAIGETDR
jgi:hypothetical protein